MSTGGMKMLDGYVEISARNKLRGGLHRATRQMVDFAGRMRAAAFAGGALTAGLGAAMMPAIQQFADFDDRMRLLQGILNDVSRNEMQLIRDQVRQLGAETSFTADQIADAAVNLGRAGLSASELGAALPHVLNLARATGTDLALAAEVAAKSMRIFHMDASQAEEIVDTFVATTNNSATTLEQLWEAVSYGGRTAYEAGLDIKQLAAFMGIMADNGIEASRAGTDLRRTIKFLTDETRRAKLRENLGVDTIFTEDDRLDLARTMQGIADAMEVRGFTRGQRLGLMTEIFGLRGDMASILLDSTVALSEMNETLEESGGIAARVATMMDSGLGGALRMLMSAINELNIAMGEALAGPLTGFFAVFKGGITILGSFIRENKTLASVLGIVMLGAIAAAGAFTVLSLVLLLLSQIVTASITAWGALTTFFSGGLNVAIGAAIVGLGTMLFLMSAVMGIIALRFQSTQALFKSLGDQIQRTVTFLSDAFELVSKAAQLGKWDVAAMELGSALITAFDMFMIYIQAQWPMLVYYMSKASQQLWWMQMKWASQFFKWLQMQIIKLPTRPFRYLWHRARGANPQQAARRAMGLPVNPEAEWRREAAKRLERYKEELAERRRLAEEERKAEEVRKYGRELTPEEAAAAMPAPAAVGTFAGNIMHLIGSAPTGTPAEETNDWLEKIHGVLVEENEDTKDVKENGLPLSYST